MQSLCEPLHLTRLQPQPMIRLRTRIRWRGLDRVKPRHPARIIRLATRRELPRINFESGKSAVQEVGVEGNDRIGGINLVSGLDDLSEGLLRSELHGVAIDRLVAVPLGLRHELLNRFELRRDARGRSGAGEEAHTASAERALRVDYAAHRSQKGRPG